MPIVKLSFAACCARLATRFVSGVGHSEPTMQLAIDTK